MDIKAIEQLVSIIRNARISELTVAANSPESVKIRLRKPLQQMPAAPETKVHAARKPAAPESAPELKVQEVYVTAPMVGIFHSIDSMSTIGAAVKAGQVVGSIESMKLMNDVVCEQDGVIVEVLIEDGMPVEYGQRLFRLE